MCATLTRAARHAIRSPSLIGEAQKELDKAKPNKAIKKYKDAWKKAHEAVK